MYALLTQLLDIRNYQVVSAEIGTDKITLDIEGLSIAFPIRSLDRHLRQRHALTVAKPQKRCTKDTPASFVTSLSAASRLISAFVRRRFFCDDCQRAFSESLGFVDERRDYTRRYQNWIFLQVRENNISAVHRAEGLTYDQIESIFFHEARCRIPLTPFANLKRSTERIASRIYYRPRCSLS